MNIDFVLWTVLFPVATAVIDYLNEKQRIMAGRKEYSDEVRLMSDLVQVIIWVSVGYALYTS